MTKNAIRTLRGPLSVADKIVLLYNKGYRIVPAACACGGRWAWVKKVDSSHGAEQMIGCVCHHTPKVKRDGKIEYI